MSALSGGIEGLPSILLVHRRQSAGPRKQAAQVIDHLGLQETLAHARVLLAGEPLGTLAEGRALFFRERAKSEVEGVRFHGGGFRNGCRRPGLAGDVAQEPPSVHGLGAGRQRPLFTDHLGQAPAGVANRFPLALLEVEVGHLALDLRVAVGADER